MKRRSSDGKAGIVPRLVSVVAAVLAANLIATPAMAQVVTYYHLDAIGNVRAVTNQSGNTLPPGGETHAYFPFGEEKCGTAVCPTVPAGQPKRFTGKETDTETGFSYFGARYYGSRIGRFTTLDPAYTLRENLVDPQKWNRYAYGRNNPLRFVDPDGRVVNDSKLAENNDYQKWKAEYLSHPEARAQWDALDKDDTVTVNMDWKQHGSSVTDGYDWNDGHLTTVTVTLSKETGQMSKGLDAETGYVHGSAITGAAQRHAYVFAHELAHVEYAQTTAGHEALEAKRKDYEFMHPIMVELGNQAALQRADVAAANGRVLSGNLRRELDADQRGWDVVKP